MRASIYVSAVAVATLALSLSAVPAAGKNKSKSKPKPAATGTIEGIIAFDGKPPARKLLDRSSDPVCAKTKALDASVVVTDGGVESAFVVVGGKWAVAETPADPVVIDQKDCMYHPRVSGVMRGQKLQIRNSDGTMHNVHAYMDGSTEFNMAQPKGARPIERAFDTADVLELKCDVHRWMVGYAVVVDHPYYAVSGKGGAFTIANVPAGSHELEIWHPTLGKRTVKADVKPGKTVTVKATY